MANNKRLDLETIVNLVPTGAKVLDLGCGDGTLLARLMEQKQVEARGVEISEANVRACITKGLSVRHGNIENGLADYPDHAFDFVILSQTLAYLSKPAPVVKEMLRVGRHSIISFDNAGHWLKRWRALFGRGMGTTLISGEPRVRSITLDQFKEFVESLDAVVEKSVYISDTCFIHCRAPLCSTVAVFLLGKKTPAQ